MTLISSETAVLVIDMQNDFCSSEGTLAKRGIDVSPAQELSNRLPSFIDKAREKGALIVWVRNVSSAEYLSAARLARSESLGWSSLDMAHEGSWGAELYEPYEIKDGDVELIKRKYSAFEGTSLDMLLRARGIKRVIACGTATNVCVDSTIRAAYMKDFQVYLPTDLVSSANSELAEAAIKNLGIYFCDVTDSVQLLAAR